MNSVVYDKVPYYLWGIRCNISYLICDIYGFGRGEDEKRGGSLLATLLFIVRSTITYSYSPKIMLFGEYIH